VAVEFNPNRIGRLSTEQIVAALGRASHPHPPQAEEHAGLVDAAVLIPFLWMDGCWHIFFTRRTDHLETHKGQVAFPGGAADPGDASPVETALRETYEETGISPHRVRVLGQTARLITITRFWVTPVVGAVEWPQPLRLAEAEVSRVFSVPLDWLADPQNYEIKPFLRPNGHIEQVVYFKRYDGEIIWGVTGRIMHDLIQLLLDSLE